MQCFHLDNSATIFMKKSFSNSDLNNDCRFSNIQESTMLFIGPFYAQFIYILIKLKLLIP